MAQDFAMDFGGGWADIVRAEGADDPFNVGATTDLTFQAVIRTEFSPFNRAQCLFTKMSTTPLRG